MTRVAQEKERIVNILSKWGPISTLNEDQLNQYTEEAKKLQEVVQELENMEQEESTTLSEEKLKYRNKISAVYR